MNVIKNYTSTVPAERSIMQIEKLLAGFGVTHTNKKYDNGKVSALAFQIMVNDQMLVFKLPANVEGVSRVLAHDGPGPLKKDGDRRMKQAERTAWKNLLEWVEIQLSMIKMEQAEFLEIFLPYVYDPGSDETYYSRLKGSGFKALPTAGTQS